MLNVDFINQRLNDLGMTQRQFAERVGVNESFVSLVVNKQRFGVSFSTACKMADALNCSLDELRTHEA
jgi:transcriptional regulator with XRE-family HTH domain